MAHPGNEVGQREAVPRGDGDRQRGVEGCADATLGGDARTGLENCEERAERLDPQALSGVALVDDAVDSDPRARGWQAMAIKVANVRRKLAKDDPRERR